MTQTFLISWPPSVNNIWRAVNGRNILSRRYRSWRESAAKELLLVQKPKPVNGPVRILIELSPPHHHRFDVDNKAKVLLDLLVRCAIIEADDNSTVKELTLRISQGFIGARVTVEAAP
jgi:Holliday junction resolvase RusA-like endonuclease